MESIENDLSELETACASITSGDAHPPNEQNGMSICGWLRNGWVERDLAEKPSLSINIDICADRLPEIRHLKMSGITSLKSSSTLSDERARSWDEKKPVVNRLAH